MSTIAELIARGEKPMTDDDLYAIREFLRANDPEELDARLRQFGAHNARMAQDFTSPQGRAEQERHDADRAYRRWRVVSIVCAVCAGAVLGFVAGMVALHLITVTAANLAAPMEGKPW